jgi:hypothetical protein
MELAHTQVRRRDGTPGVTFRPLNSRSKATTVLDIRYSA